MTSNKELRYCEQCLSETVHLIVRKRPALQAKVVERFAEKAKIGEICELNEEFDTHSRHCICEKCGKKSSY